MPRRYQKKSASKSKAPGNDDLAVSDDTYRSDAEDNNSENNISGADSDAEMTEAPEMPARVRNRARLENNAVGDGDDIDDDDAPRGEENDDDEKESATPVKKSKGRRGRPKKAARRKPKDDENDEDDVGDEDEGGMHQVARASTHRNRKVLDTPVPPRSRVRFAIGKNVLARVNRSWTPAWVVALEGSKVCVRWLNGEKAAGGHSEKWVTKKNVHVLSRVQVASLRDGTQTVNQVIQEIRGM